MKPPFFSIIIPTRNPSMADLSECLQSIAGQTNDDYETIVIDCISELSSQVKRLCSKFNQISYLVDAEGRGVYAAMNQGVKRSSGKWILFLGHEDKLIDRYVLRRSQDLIMPNSLFLWKQAFYGNVKVYGNAGWAQDGAIYDGEFTYAKLTGKNICHQAIFYRGSHARGNASGYSSEYPISADWEYNIRAWTRGGMTYLPFVVSIFKGGGLSSSSENDGFNGKLSLTWEYWKTRRPWFIAYLTLIYCNVAASSSNLCSRIRRRLSSGS